MEKMLLADVIESWRLNFNLGTVVECIRLSSFRKPKGKLDTLKKALLHLRREVELLESAINERESDRGISSDLINKLKEKYPLIEVKDLEEGSK